MRDGVSVRKPVIMTGGTGPITTHKQNVTKEHSHTYQPGTSSPSIVCQCRRISKHPRRGSCWERCDGRYRGPTSSWMGFPCGIRSAFPTTMSREVGSVRHRHSVPSGKYNSPWTASCSFVRGGSSSSGVGSCERTTRNGYKRKNKRTCSSRIISKYLIADRVEVTGSSIIPFWRVKTQQRDVPQWTAMPVTNIVPP